MSLCRPPRVRVLITLALTSHLCEMFQQLPRDLIVCVASWLDSNDLCRLSAVNFNFHSIASTESLWHTLCQSRWRDKRHVSVDPSLPMPNLPAQCHELHRAWLSSITLCRLRTLAVSEWKQAYYFVERDAARTAISMHELCQNRWSFAFKSPFNLFIHAGNEMRIYSEFFDDMTYQSEAFFDERIEWCWIDRDDTDGQRLHEYLQVSHYPPLRLLRSSDWSWRLENSNVVLRQVFESDNGEEPELGAAGSDYGYEHGLIEDDDFEMGDDEFFNEFASEDDDEFPNDIDELPHTHDDVDPDLQVAYEQLLDDVIDEFYPDDEDDEDSLGQEHEVDAAFQHYFNALSSTILPDQLSQSSESLHSDSESDDDEVPALLDSSTSDVETNVDWHANERTRQRAARVDIDVERVRDDNSSIYRAIADADEQVQSILDDAERITEEDDK